MVVTYFNVYKSAVKLNLIYSEAKLNYQISDGIDYDKPGIFWLKFNRSLQNNLEMFVNKVFHAYQTFKDITTIRIY